VTIPDGYRSDPISPDLSPPFRMAWRSKQPAVPLALNSDALRRWRHRLGRRESGAERTDGEIYLGHLLGIARQTLRLKLRELGLSARHPAVAEEDSGYSHADFPISPIMNVPECPLFSCSP